MYSTVRYSRYSVRYKPITSDPGKIIIIPTLLTSLNQVCYNITHIKNKNQPKHLVNFKVNLKQFVSLLNQLLKTHKNSISDEATLSASLIDGSSPLDPSFSSHPFAQIFLIAEEPNTLLPDGSILQGLRLFCIAPRDPSRNDLTPVNIDDYLLEQIATNSSSNSLLAFSSSSSNLTPDSPSFHRNPNSVTQLIDLDLDKESLQPHPSHFNCA